MEKKLNVMKAVEAYKVLKSAKYQKLSDEDKIKVWKLYRQLKTIGEEYAENVEDARQKFLPSEDFAERFQQAVLYEQEVSKGSENLPLTKEEYEAFLKQLKDYNELVKKAVDSYAGGDISIDYEPLSEKDFGLLMSSNDWTMSEVESLEFVCE